MFVEINYFMKNVTIIVPGLPYLRLNKLHTLNKNSKV